jgi:hypothetical protein
VIRPGGRDMTTFRPQPNSVDKMVMTCGDKGGP